MELRHLRYFIAVAEEQSVTRAAAKLHLSQPPLTRQIHNLEEELGVQLFRRTPNSMRLTEGGKRFGTEARKILLQVDRTIQAMAAFKKGQRAELRVGYSPFVSSDILPEILHRFKADEPHVRVKFLDMPSQELMIQIAGQKLEVALTVKSRVELPRTLRFDPLRKYRAGVFVPQGHRFTTMKRVEISDVAKESLVTPSSKEYPNYHHFLRAIFRKVKKTPQVAQECSGQASLFAAITSGYGIAVMFELPPPLRPGIEFVPFKPGVEPLTVGLLYRYGEPSLRLAAFINAAKSLRSKQSASPGHPEEKSGLSQAEGSSTKLPHSTGHLASS